MAGTWSCDRDFLEFIFCLRDTRGGCLAAWDILSMLSRALTGLVNQVLKYDTLGLPEESPREVALVIY